MTSRFGKERRVLQDRFKANSSMSRHCQPLAGSLLETCLADENGAYGIGFHLRGHQFTDVQGRWWFNTIILSLYPGRTRHFHFTVQRPGGRVLTTRLHLPGEPQNLVMASFTSPSSSTQSKLETDVRPFRLRGMTTSKGVLGSASGRFHAAPPCNWREVAALTSGVEAGVYVENRPGN